MLFRTSSSSIIHCTPPSPHPPTVSIFSRHKTYFPSYYDRFDRQIASASGTVTMFDLSGFHNYSGHSLFLPPSPNFWFSIRTQLLVEIYRESHIDAGFILYPLVAILSSRNTRVKQMVGGVDSLFQKVLFLSFSLSSYHALCSNSHIRSS